MRQLFNVTPIGRVKLKQDITVDKNCSIDPSWLVQFLPPPLPLPTSSENQGNQVSPNMLA